MLERATALITPGPADSEIDSKQVVEDYVFLADDYKALQLPIKELVSLEKAFAVLQTAERRAISSADPCLLERAAG